MIDGIAIQQEMVGDNTAVAPPPDCLRAHQGQATIPAKALQSAECRGEFIAQGIVGIVVKALHPPERVDLLVDAWLPWPPTAQNGPVTIADL